jgi:hypothetical protein
MSSGARTAGVVIAGIACALAFLVAIAPLARAEGPTLTVTDLGQESAPVGVGQPPLPVSSTASCAHAFTLANEGACPPGTWPPLGRSSFDPGGWGPSEHVAGGDTLRLAFSTPVLSVAVGSTSNYEPGLHDPDGGAIPNFDVIPESPATATVDPAVWLVTLPPLDVRAIGGYTFSVVGEDESGFHDYPLEIRSPRWADELTLCGTAYYSTGFSQSLCPSNAAPPGVPGAVSHRKKRRRCRHGFRRRVVHGKRRCVRVKRHRKRHRRHRHRRTSS